MDLIYIFSIWLLPVLVAITFTKLLTDMLPVSSVMIRRHDLDVSASIRSGIYQ